MADETTTTDAPTEPPEKKRGLIKVLKAIAFVAGIVLLEIVAASMLAPTEAETAEIAEKLMSKQASSEDQANRPGREANRQKLPLENMVEVSLGSFHVLTYNPQTGTSLNIDFDLYGTVLAEDEAEFNFLFQANEKRIREQVLIIARGSEVTDLTDAGLGLIKRKILEKANHALGKPLLHEAIFSRFSFQER